MLRFLLQMLRNLTLALPTAALAASGDETWLLAERQEGGNIVLYRFRASLPEEATIHRFQSLATVDWDYAPRAHGTPQPDASKKIYELEDILEKELESKGICVLAFTRTGNGGKQWGYYVSNPEQFKIAFVRATSGNDFPIRIHFLSDPSWNLLSKLQRSARR